MTHTRRGLTTLQIVLIVLGVLVLIGGCMIAVLIALLLPALTQARTTAQGLRSEFNITEVLISADLNAMDEELMNISDDADAPTDAALTTTMVVIDTQALIDAQLITSMVLDSPFDDDGVGDDYWTYSQPFDMTIQHATGPMIVMYDQEMYAAQQNVAVGFSDGSADVIPIAEFEALLRNPTNAKTDFQLPTRNP